MNTRIETRPPKRLPTVALLAILTLPVTTLGQQTEEDANPIGFRTDLGIHLSFGGQTCAGSTGAAWLKCSGNNVGWQMGTGVALGATVRPFRHFSIGLDGAYMALKPLEGTEYDTVYKRFFDISLGAVLKGHLPIRIKQMLLDLALGLRIGFVNGYLKANPNAGFQAVIEDDSSVYRHRHFGPEVTPMLNVVLFVVPKIGFGFEMRAPMTLYQQVCFDQGSGNGAICRGMEDSTANEAKQPLKLFFGLHVIYYL